LERRWKSSSGLLPVQPAHHRVELSQQRGVARLGRRQNRIVERAIRAVWTGFMLRRKIAQQARQQSARGLRIGPHDLDHRRHVDVVVFGCQQSKSVTMAMVA